MISSHALNKHIGCRTPPCTAAGGRYESALGEDLHHAQFMHACMDALIDGCLHACMDALIDGCLHAWHWMHVWIDAWMDVWMPVSRRVARPRGGGWKNLRVGHDRMTRPVLSGRCCIN